MLILLSICAIFYRLLDEILSTHIMQGCKPQPRSEQFISHLVRAQRMAPPLSNKWLSQHITCLKGGVVSARVNLRHILTCLRSPLMRVHVEPTRGWPHNTSHAQGTCGFVCSHWYRHFMSHRVNLRHTLVCLRSPLMRVRVEPTRGWPHITSHV